MVSIGEVRELAYRKSYRFDRTTTPAKWRLETRRGRLATGSIEFRDAYVMLMGMPDSGR